tara:strand:- start:275 stop:574 length:300 start_codon:yes stop_codon:yes gene_type:complete
MASTIENKVDLLIGVVQNLKTEIESLKGAKVPSARWVSTAELGNLVGIKGRTITNWCKQGKFPPEVLRKKMKGKQYHYRLDSDRAVSIAEKIMFGEHVS